MKQNNKWLYTNVCNNEPCILSFIGSRSYDSNGVLFMDTVTQENLKQFPKLELVTIDKTFGGWAQAQKKHFADGGIFDEIQK